MKDENCTHEALQDTGVGYYHCPICGKGWTYDEWNTNTPHPEAKGEIVYEWADFKKKHELLQADYDRLEKAFEELLSLTMVEGSEGQIQRAIYLWKEKAGLKPREG